MRLFNWPWGNLEPHTYDFVMSDFAWNYKLRSSRGERKSAQAQYKTMSLEEIMALPVLDLCSRTPCTGCGATNPMLDKAIAVMRAQGFDFKTAGTWLKTTKHGKIGFGTGYILRSSNEPFIIGTRGKPKTTRSVRSGFLGLAREHSRKPEEAYRAAELLMPNAR
ncbi:MT-A70 family protein [Rhizobium gallicum]|uniref:MT-A70 family protein n=1 Tax=Rhizobium gallicum TaxID=56730 RepID=A0A1L5NHI9_9HYPH|nr:MT-A70 family protein [Rhizobium gallicum]